MCVGIPHRVVEAGFGFARAVSRLGEATIDMRLVGDQPPGTPVLVFLGAAREVLTETEAKRIEDALEAVGRAMAGDGAIDHLFADLVGREPRLPDHLLPDHLLTDHLLTDREE